MIQTKFEETNTREFGRHVDEIRQKLEKMPLSDDEILLLACREISNTFTRDEKNYK